MTFGDRVGRLATLGFPERQASFLVNVMLHAGVCVQRQYHVSAKLAHGCTTREFFRELVTKRHATAYPCARRGSLVYHVHARPLYEAIGEPHNRHRRPVALGRAVERLMVLDAVLAAPDVTWLATESDKVAHFTTVRDFTHDQLPQLIFVSGASRTTRYFPDKLPIGLRPDGRTYEFLYAVDRAAPGDFRVFLYRHAPLLRRLPKWTIRLLVPPHLAEFAKAFEAAAHEELDIRLAPKTVEELRWFFQARQQRTDGAPPSDAERYHRARRAFGAPRYRVLYRHWRVAGDAVIDGLLLPAISDAIARQTGRIQVEVLSRPYHYLAPLVGTA